MRLVLDITKTRDGRYEGHLTIPGTTGQQDFEGILELLAVLEQYVHLDEDTGSADSGNGADWDDGIIDGGTPT
jgi:hypothetical protein